MVMESSVRSAMSIATCAPPSAKLRRRAQPQRVVVHGANEQQEPRFIGSGMYSCLLAGGFVQTCRSYGACLANKAVDSIDMALPTELGDH
jgi:hypothetical protein